ncbi:unnamed protein product [Peniophora sp. CBMAI 1063]|nr:unnamed protein product [Peniophora sp. CBMAI 1063]
MRALPALTTISSVQEYNPRNLPSSTDPTHILANMGGDTAAPNNKRQRVGDESEPSNQFEQHDRLWFADGNVILRCEQTDFRVHRSLLATHSEVFRDMFTVGTPMNQAYDDVPVVHLADDLKSLTTLLLFIYFHDEDYDNMTWVLDLLEISTKYIVPLPRDRCLAVIRRFFPDTLEKYQEEPTYSRRYSINLCSAARCHKLATDNNLATCLPAIRCFCADIFAFHSSCEGYDPREEIQHCPSSLQVEIMAWGRALLAAKRDILDKHIQEFLENSDRETDYHCADELAIAFLSYKSEDCVLNSNQHLRYENDLQLFPPTSFAVDLSKRSGDVCGDCEADWKEKEMAGRIALWEELPKYTSLGTWQELRAREG